MQQLQQPDQAQQQVAPIQPAATVLYQSQQIPVTYQNQNTSEVPGKQASAVSTVQVMQATNPSQISTAMLYQGSKTVTPRQQALLSQVPHTQGRLMCPCHEAANSPGEHPEPPRKAPMRHMDVESDCSLDYVPPQSIKFYHRAIEKLPGEKFNGNMLHTWLKRINDRAISCAWTSIFNIKGRLITEKYAELTLKDVKTYAQEYQNEGMRRAQNAEMLLQCLKASISKAVYSRISQLRHNYTIIREPEKQEVQDGLCYLKTIIDCYHANTRSSTAEIRKQLAQLHIYMKHTAKGDVVQLCIYTRDLLEKLRAADEETHDLLTNLIAALRQTSNPHFHRWLNFRVDMWSAKKIEWQPDGYDLMQEAEEYYLELKTTNMWPKKKDNSIHAKEYTEENIDFYGDYEETPRDKGTSTPSAKASAALAHQLENVNKATRNIAMSQKHKWKYIAPKEGKPIEKYFYQCGKKMKFYWCTHHKQWTRHKPSECMLLEVKTERHGKAKQGDYQNEKQVYKKVKALMQALNLLSTENEEGDNQDQIIDDSDSDSNFSGSTMYYSDDDDSNFS